MSPNPNVQRRDGGAAVGEWLEEESCNQWVTSYPSVLVVVLLGKTLHLPCLLAVPFIKVKSHSGFFAGGKKCLVFSLEPVASAAQSHVTPPPSTHATPPTESLTKAISKPTKHNLTRVKI